ncbi:zwei Ig domain protein zig-8-like [Oratosquilla oratoria]|uniref:zwei Ig domain protein zig-8-like n=1 Tax=Oratosquilla oratoria TaxID=337810 RepID=UPI003F769528
MNTFVSFQMARSNNTWVLAALLATQVAGYGSLQLNARGAATMTKSGPGSQRGFIIPGKSSGYGEDQGRTEDPVWEIRHLLPETRFDNNSVVNVTIQVGNTAFLPCKLRSLPDQEISEEQVSWFRRRDWHILTTGIFTYTTDQRFAVLHPRDSEDWTLQIKYATVRDDGTYECQLSTGTGVTSQFVNMRVVEPRAVIVGGDLHVQSGSEIRLVCIIEQSPIPPQYVFWFHAGRMVNYDKERGGINVTTTNTHRTHSRLIVTDARESDSGNYTCSASNTRPASVSVFVYYGDNTAAIQRRKSSGSLGISQLGNLFLLLITTSLIVATTARSSCYSSSSANYSSRSTDSTTSSPITSTKTTDRNKSTITTTTPKTTEHTTTRGRNNNAPTRLQTLHTTSSDWSR